LYLPDRRPAISAAPIASGRFFANTLPALDAATGKRTWHFQWVRHDMWHRDFPSPSALVRVRHEGKMPDAVAQANKSALFVGSAARRTNRCFPSSTGSIRRATFPVRWGILSLCL
jgi:quinoprotein glucose dehydrogenase